MSILNTDKSLVLIIDIQEKLLNAVYNKELIEKNSEIIIKTASALNLPMIITEQYPKGLGKTIAQISNNANQDNTLYFEKVDFNALASEDIFKSLEKLNRKQIILCGIETHICVHQTAEALIKNGYEVNILSDLCSSRSEYEYTAGINLIKQNGGIIKTTEIALFELLKSAKHPNFKEVQALIK